MEIFKFGWLFLLVGTNTLVGRFSKSVCREEYFRGFQILQHIEQWLRKVQPPNYSGHIKSNRQFTKRHSRYFPIIIFEGQNSNQSNPSSSCFPPNNFLMNLHLSVSQLRHFWLKWFFQDYVLVTHRTMQKINRRAVLSQPRVRNCSNSLKRLLLTLNNAADDKENQ